MKVHCIYHGNCADGFTSAWIVHNALKDKAELTFTAGVYQRPPPDIDPETDIVLFVDFSYQRRVMMEVASRLRNGVIMVLDHHKSASENLYADPRDQIYRVPDPRAANANWNGLVDELGTSRALGEPIAKDIYCLFDMDRSGAGITWDFFNPGQPRPALVNHVEDRDLWRFKLPGTREIQANLFSYPYDFDKWSEIAMHLEDEDAHLRFAQDGTAIERKHFKDIAELLTVVTRPMKFRVSERTDVSHVIVPIANLPYTMVSDAGERLIECDLRGHPDAMMRHPFAGCYYDGPHGRNFSLRSREGGMDVSIIAKLYGGGGHAQAAGFRVPFDQLAQFEP